MGVQRYTGGAAPPVPLRPRTRTAITGHPALLAAAGRILRLRKAPVPGRSTLLGLLLGHILCIPVWLPWISPQMDFLQSDDSLAHLIRIYHVTWLAEHGVWYARWIPDMFLGYGYPLLNFYAPGLYYVCWATGLVLHLKPWDAYQASGLLTCLAGLTGMFLLARRLWQRIETAVFAMVCFGYLPYVFHLLLYRRGDVPELLGLCLIPWLLLAIVCAASPGMERRRGVLVPSVLGTGVSGALVILAHNLTAVSGAVISAVLAVLLVAITRDRIVLARLTVGAALAAGLTAGFWLPLVSEAHLVRLESLVDPGSFDWRTELVDPAHPSHLALRPDNRQSLFGLIDLHWEYPNQIHTTPKPSLAQALLFCLAVAAAGKTLLGRPDTRARHDAVIVAGLLAAALLCWLLTLSLSRPVWESIGLLRFYQFPGRLFGPIGVLLPLAAAGALHLVLPASNHRHRTRAAVVPAAVTVLLAAFVMVNGGTDRELASFDQRSHSIDAAVVRQDELSYHDAGTTGNREFLPRTVDIPEYTAGIPRYRDVIERLYPESEWTGGLFWPLGGQLSFTAWRGTPLRMTTDVDNRASTPGVLGVRQLLFPGWHAWLDGVPVPLFTAPHSPSQQASPGFIAVEVPPGQHEVTVAAGASAPVALGMVLSSATLTAIGVALGRSTPRGGRRRLRGWVALAAGVVLLLVSVVALGRTLAPNFHRFAVVGEAAPQTRTLVANVARETQLGHATITSPGGPRLGADAYVDVRFLTVRDATDPARDTGGQTTREWLYMHPQSSVAITLALPDTPGLAFRTLLAMDPETWSMPAGDGVRFIASVTPLEGTPAAGSGGAGDAAAAGSSETLLDISVNPRAHLEQRKWLPVSADLSGYRGRQIRLTLSTEYGEDATYDWGGWGDPVVVVDTSARGPVLPGSQQPL